MRTLQLMLVLLPLYGCDPNYRAEFEQRPISVLVQTETPALPAQPKGKVRICPQPPPAPEPPRTVEQIGDWANTLYILYTDCRRRFMQYQVDTIQKEGDAQ